jgi:hypothetical protein
LAEHDPEGVAFAYPVAPKKNLVHPLDSEQKLRKHTLKTVAPKI